MRWVLRRAGRALGALAATILLGGLLAATLMRFAPGFGIDERELDSRLNSSTLEAIRRSHAGERDTLGFYARFLARMLHGDLGVSQLWGRPVAELLRERIPITFKPAGAGLLAGWTVGLALALATLILKCPALDVLSGVLSSLFLCLPSSVLALLLVFSAPTRGVSISVAAAISLVVFPRVFRYARGVLGQVARRPHVLAAHTRGIPAMRAILVYILPGALPPILALLGVSVSVTFGAAIPIEVICDSPGIGQLAWQAALQRDLPVLLNLTLLVTLITVAANSLAQLAGGRESRS